MSDADVIATFIQEELLDEDPSDLVLAPDDNLLKRGSIDSLGIIRLLDFLEETFGVEIPAGEVTIQNFGTVNAMLALIARKRSAD